MMRAAAGVLAILLGFVTIMVAAFVLAAVPAGGGVFLVGLAMMGGGGVLLLYAPDSDGA